MAKKGFSWETFINIMMVGAQQMLQKEMYKYQSEISEQRQKREYDYRLKREEGIRHEARRYDEKEFNRQFELGQNEKRAFANFQKNLGLEAEEDRLQLQSSVNAAYGSPATRQMWIGASQSGDPMKIMQVQAQIKLRDEIAAGLTELSDQQKTVLRTLPRDAQFTIGALIEKRRIREEDRADKLKYYNAEIRNTEAMEKYRLAMVEAAPLERKMKTREFLGKAYDRLSDLTKEDIIKEFRRDIANIKDPKKQQKAFMDWSGKDTYTLNQALQMRVKQQIDMAEKELYGIPEKERPLGDREIRREREDFISSRPTDSPGYQPGLQLGTVGRGLGITAKSLKPDLDRLFVPGTSERVRSITGKAGSAVAGKTSPAISAISRYGSKATDAFLDSFKRRTEKRFNDLFEKHGISKDVIIYKEDDIEELKKSGVEALVFDRQSKLWYFVTKDKVPGLMLIDDLSDLYDNLLK